MIGNWPQLIVVIALVLSPFIIYGAYLFLRRENGRMPEGKPKAASAPHLRTEPSLGSSVPVGASGVPQQPRRGNEPGIGGFGSGGNNLEAADEADDDADEADAAEDGAVELDVPPSQEAVISRHDERETRDEGQAEGAKADDEGEPLDSFGLPEGGGTPIVSGTDPAREKGGGGHFPEVSEELPEPFYYKVRMTVEKGMGAPDVHQLLRDLVSKTNVRMYQTMLCFDRDKGKWETPRPEKKYEEFVWAVPMCNRSSHLSPGDISGVVNVIQDMMRRVDGQAEFPSHNDLDERRELVDKFCDHVDHGVTVNLIALSSSGGVPQRSGDIIDLAISGDMEMIDNELRRVVNGETWYVLKDGNGNDLTRNSPDRKVASLMVTLDFPHVSTPVKAFDEMFKFTGMLSRVLGFSFVDSEKNPVDQEQIAEARDHLADLTDYMTESMVPPGSKVARALFS